MSIGKNIAELRREKGLTQQQLAEKLGVSGQSISKWENDVCAPDVAQFPQLAELFGVSIDRLYGFRLAGGEEVQAIIDKADESETLEEYIAQLKAGLEKYPNSARLKIDLASSCLSAWRLGMGGVEKEEAEKRCLELCREVIRTCGDRQQVDDALTVMSRAYRESGEYELALQCLEKLSAESYGMRLFEKASVLRARGEHAALERFGEWELFYLWSTLYLMLFVLSADLSAQGKTEQALTFAETGERLLTLYDAGCEGFYAFRKVTAAENSASLRMDLGDKAGCLEALKRVLSCAELARSSADAESHHVADRNTLFFSGLRADPRALEEWAPEVFILPLMKKYESFFGDDEEFRELLKQAEKYGNPKEHSA